MMAAEERFLAELASLTRVRLREPLARHTTFHIGGPADYYVVAHSAAELAHLVALARSHGMPCFIFGGSSNILVADAGIRGLVINNRASLVEFLGPREPDSAPARELVAAESGAPLGHLARQAVRRGLSGLEWAIGIPGTVGGGVVFNAGAHGHALSEVLHTVHILDSDGVMRWLSQEELTLGYRSSRFTVPQDQVARPVILAAHFLLEERPREEMEERVKEYAAYRRTTQPTRSSAGSIFKNPPQTWAGWLVERADLKGTRRGNAQISERHANFIVNLGGATAAEVKALIDLAQERVRERFGVELELEVQLVGAWG